MTNHDDPDRAMTVSRVIEAPVETIFNAWADPAQIALWWGPDGFTVSTHRMEFKPGGEWDFIMHGPDGTDYKNLNTFREIVKNERIAYTHDTTPYFAAEATFTPAGKGIEVTLRMVFENKRLRDEIAKFAVEGGNQTLARLEAHVAKVQAGSRPASDPGLELVITRLIRAPREKVFEAWTQRLKEWWGPHGMTTPFVEMDLRPGGAFRTVMRAPDGSEYPTRGVFLEVVAPERIVFSDAFDPGWIPHPEPFLTAVTTFADVGDGRTMYMARALHKSGADREAHGKMGFFAGWGQSLDRLVALVEQP